MKTPNKILVFTILSVLLFGLFIANNAVCAEWTVMGNIPTTETLYDVWGASGNEVFAVGGQDTILFFDGSSWTEQNYTSDGATLYDVWGNSGNNVYAVGFNGRIRHYDGFDWSAISSGTIASLNGVWVSPNGEVFIVGEMPSTGGAAIILHYTGSSWETQDSGTTNTLNAVWGTSENEVFAVGANGIILKYDGNNWAPMDTDTITTWLTCIWGSSGSNVYAGGATNIYHYNGNDLDTWTESVNVVEYPDGLWGTASNNVYAVGGSDQDVIEHFDGNLWSVQYYPGYHPNGIWGRSASNIFVVGDLGMILRYGEQHRPNKPTLVGPSNEAVFPENSYITIESSAFSDPDSANTLQSSSWKVIRDDTGEVIFERSNTLTEYFIETMYENMAPGLKYIWQVQHTDNTGRLSLWSDEFAFKIGTSEPDTLETVQAGKSLGDFGMVSIVHWPDNPDPESVFGITYDSNNYRIGAWDPEQNKYTEADKGLVIKPGRAYWILTRDPLEVHFTGVPVSMVNDIEVCLHTETSAGTGWNMIAPPNAANYFWNDVMVGRWLGDNHPDNVSPVPVTYSAASDLINHRIWEWKDGGYVNHKLEDNFVLEHYKGYWVKALVDGAYLVFPESARVGGLSTPRNTMLAWKDKAVRWMKSLLPAPSEAMADNDLPPVPMESFDGSTNPLFEGCFIESVNAFR